MGPKCAHSKLNFELNVAGNEIADHDDAPGRRGQRQPHSRQYLPQVRHCLPCALSVDTLKLLSHAVFSYKSTASAIPWGRTLSGHTHVPKLCAIFSGSGFHITAEATQIRCLAAPFIARFIIRHWFQPIPVRSPQKVQHTIIQPRHLLHARVEKLLLPAREEARKVAAFSPPQIICFCTAWWTEDDITARAP
ncbi:hypothetical protein B0H12DRAFT_88941 [Mycena haematopus]|nr:hypothetical protein B0H12DRAFT_88941 [Mycena haematopus]